MPVRTIVIQRSQAGQSVAEVLRGTLRLGRGLILQYLRDRQVRLGGHLCQAPGRRVRSGQRLEIMLAAPKKAAHKAPRGGKKASERPAPIRSPLAGAIRVRYLDAHILVVDKPAGLTTVRHASEKEELGRRAQKFLPPTLVDLLPGILPVKERTGRFRAVHRLDKETSGLVVLARTAAAETHLGLQFRAHTIERAYLALVRGRARAQRIESHLLRDRGDGRRGSGPTEEGQRAVTTIEVVEKLGDFTLVACRLETGRTHQVRIHLGEHGTPLCGERVYDRPLHGKPAPDTSGARRPLLHATVLAIDHPASGQRLTWKAKLPKDMDEVLRKVRYHKKS
ncbi:MAG TPA: RluA family pseudouridine synthase [Gemmataceae bacterium]|nr:RluA family pseudouridine synthase [Gemmataceae bacterium]